MSAAPFVYPVTIDEVIQQLDVIIEDSLRNPSRMGYFAALYKAVTVEVKNRIQDSYFDDNPRMEQMDVIFANRYLEAYHLYQQGELCSASWQLAFEADQWWNPLVIQHLIAGMNAHIGLDLGIAASETSPQDIAALQNDFNKINEVLGSLIDKVQNDLAAIFWPLKPIDWLLGRADEKIARFAMDIARNAAWKVAVDYSALKTDAERSVYLKARDEAVTRFSRKIVRPRRYVRFLIAFFRVLEFGGIRYKIRILNR